MGVWSANIVGMAKRRKTRREKERAAARKKQASYNRSATAQSGVAAAEPKPSVDDSSKEAQANNSEDLQRHRKRMRTMRLSLIVFAVLAFLQIGLWVLEYYGLVSFDFISL